MVSRRLRATLSAEFYRKGIGCHGAALITPRGTPSRTFGLARTRRPTYLPTMPFMVTKADADAIRAAYEHGGELSAVVELRRLFPGLANNENTRACALSIAGWMPRMEQVPTHKATRRPRKGQSVPGDPTKKPYPTRPCPRSGCTG